VQCAVWMTGFKKPYTKAVWRLIFRNFSQIVLMMLSLVKRTTKPVSISRRNTELFVQTVYYKDNPRAFWNMLLILAMVAAAFVSVIFINGVLAVCLIVAMFALPVYAAVSGKTWFSFNATHDKPLIFEPGALQLGDEFFRLADLEEVNLYIHSFYGFRYMALKKGGTGPEQMLGSLYESEYGDKNELSFRANGSAYTCRFLLGSGTAWFALYEIMAAWKQQGVTVNLREEYSYEFVYNEIVRMSGAI
jgi:hypothetical protein